MCREGVKPLATMAEKYSEIINEDGALAGLGQDDRRRRKTCRRFAGTIVKTVAVIANAMLQLPAAATLHTWENLTAAERSRHCYTGERGGPCPACAAQAEFKQVLAVLAVKSGRPAKRKGRAGGTLHEHVARAVTVSHRQNSTAMLTMLHVRHAVLFVVHTGHDSFCRVRRRGVRSGSVHARTRQIGMLFMVCYVIHLV